MRQKIFHSVFFIVLCFAFFSGNAMAQSIIVNNQCAKNSKSKLLKPDIDLSKYDKRVLGDGIEVYSKKHNTTRTPKVGAEDYATVTFKYQYDPAQFGPQGFVAVYGENIDYTEFYADYIFENGILSLSDIVCQLPKGNCDVLASALPHIDGIYKWGISYKIIEQVAIHQDTTIIIDFDDCTNQYNIQTLKLNGEEAKLDTYIRNENYEVIDTIKGNINGLGEQFSIILKGTGEVAEHFVLSGNEDYGGYLMSTRFINNVSDRYKIGVIRMIDDDSDVYAIKYETQSMSDHILQNDPNNYVHYQEVFAPSLSLEQDPERWMFIEAVATLDNVNAGGIIFGPTPASDRTTKVYIDAKQNESNEPGEYDILVHPEIVDKVKTDIYTESWEEDGEMIIFTDTIYTYLTIAGLPVMVNRNNDLEYVNASHDLGGNYAFHVPDPASTNVMTEYPGHPQFSYYSNQKVLDYGASCPINAFMAQNTKGVYGEGKNMYLQCCYIGRYGEVRNVDCDTLETKITYNNEVICDNYATLNMDLNEYCAAPNHPDGIITAHFVNKNMMVDGLQGMNVTDVYFDQRQEDWTAPTLQMMLFKDLEGNIIDRFETAEDGILEFAGGDFNYHLDLDAYYYWFDCRPQSVEVSYSPYCADNWAPLEVNEIPEEYYMPGFGYFYRGSLKDVTGRGEKGWFDLKIKLTDPSGNWQEQVISPAFRIGDSSLTNIQNVKSDTATEVARYTIDGRALSAPQAGVNIVKMSDGTVKKVLVK